ncbi:MAG: 3-oxoadipyl-CoA thiolase [Gammaproteobacteria bacterium]|nr:3-oxoadipyl-CoA thiolase [Gammaproteobacteria bacterium]
MEKALLCAYVRTPIGRYGGALSTVRTDDLAAHALRALLERVPELRPELIDDVIYGCANQSGEDNRNVARMAALLAGFPVSVAGVTVNRLCGSGMEALWRAAQAVASGQAQCVVAGGVEGMSRAPYVVGKSTSAFGRAQQMFDTTMGWRFVNRTMDKLYGTDTMPKTADNVAAEFDVSRADQDAFALRSHQKATAARDRLAREISPVAVAQRKGDDIMVVADEHPRADSTLATLARLKPLFDGGSVSAGNASGLNDGACALLVASEEFARLHRLPVLAEILGGAVAGLEPRIMGVGPLYATRKLLDRLQLSIKDFDIIELNEAFASQSLAVLRQLDIADDDERVNPLGGAIALGHPLGMSGARLCGSAAIQLGDINSGKGLALATMCIGVGQGIALALKSPPAP